MQLIEQLPTHLMWHVAPPEQSILPLLPTVIAQVDMPVHLRLHDEPHCPVQALVFAQSSEQLLSQVPAAMSQDCPAGQLHEEPLHVGGVPLSLLQAANMPSPIVKATKMIRIGPMYIVASPCGRSDDHTKIPIDHAGSRPCSCIDRATQVRRETASLADEHSDRATRAHTKTPTEPTRANRTVLPGTLLA